MNASREGKTIAVLKKGDTAGAMVKLDRKLPSSSIHITNYQIYNCTINFTYKKEPSDILIQDNHISYSEEDRGTSPWITAKTWDSVEIDPGPFHTGRGLKS
ncbi:MAG: hypothetical protein JXB88_17230 [Spirochaetales bacterium]|nr:hypothetical protein [Spirochaetales bacterium]